MRCLVGGLLVALALLGTGCGGGTRAAGEWTATVRVHGDSAVVAVQVPGQQLGLGYHVHLSLNGGPEVMMYGQLHTFADLQPGPHQVKVVLSDTNHVPMEGAERLLDFEVE